MGQNLTQVPPPGAPGNPNKLPKDKMWRTALNVALHDRRDDGTGRKVQALRLVAQSLVTQALMGERWAHEMIADRIDGPILREAAGGSITVVVNRLPPEEEMVTIEAAAE